MGDLDGQMERLQALHAQRKKAAAEVDRLDAEIRSVALVIAGAGGPVTSTPTAPTQSAPVATGPAGTAQPQNTNGVGHASPGPSQPKVTAPPPVTPPGPSRDTRPARRKLELLTFLRAHPEGDTEYFARKMYGNTSRHARINVSSYFSDLKAAGYVVVGTELGMFRLTEKGMLATEPPPVPNPDAEGGQIMTSE